MSTTQSPTAQRSITIVWILLSVITVLSWWLAPAHSDPAHSGGGVATASTPITVVVLALGFIKGRLIIRYFMEVRNAPRWLRLATDAWLVVFWLAALALYLF